MSTRLDQFKLATHPDTVAIVTASLMGAREDIVNEDPETPNHENRIVLANTVLFEVGQLDQPTIRTFAWLVARNPTILAAAVTNGVVSPEHIADGDVDYVVASNIDAVIGTE